MNTRIKDLPGAPGVKVEAIASPITIEYSPTKPLDSVILFAFRDHLVTEDGSALGFSNEGWDVIPVTVGELVGNLPEGLDILELMESVKTICDVVHNRKYGGGDEQLP